MLLLLLSGFISFGLSVPRHYVFVNESKTWAEAQRYCRDKYSDLATIENDQETIQLMDTVNDDSIDLAWIGLYDDLNSWKWTLEDSDYRNFSNQPDNSGGNELCVYMDYDGKWYDMSCDNMLPFICYDGKENATQSYIRISDEKTWSEARRYCREHYTDLANVRNQTENQMILERTGGGGWIGLYRNRVWSDKQMTSYENWKPGIPYSPAQPDNDYGEWGSPHCTAVSFKDSGRWTDENCFSSIHFFCYNRTCTQSSCTRHYHFVSENKTWFEAQRFCRQNYTDLATIDNMEEMNRLINTVNGSYNGSAWIGLYGDINSYRWSLDNAALGDHKRWRGRHPRNIGGQSLCVNMNTHNGLWSETPCSNLSPFVCYDGRENVSTNYVYVNQLKTWTEAQSYCREHHTDLISIRNENENHEFQHLFRNDFYSSFWIGLYRTRSWSDQSNSSFSNWGIGQPDNAANSEFCTTVSFSDSGSWTDENCDTAFPFICYSVSSLTSSRQYHFVSENKTWTEAQTYCRQNYTDLATIDNMEEMNSLINTVNGSYNGLAWIGLYDDLNNNRRWSLEDNDFYQEGERDFRNWYHELNNYGGKEMCVFMYWDIWFKEPCDLRVAFVCYDGRENASQKYIWEGTGRTWTEAQKYCREKYTDLASMRDETESRQVLSVSLGNVVWIGLHRNRLWSDQSNSSFTYWRQMVSFEAAQPDNGFYTPGQNGTQHCTAVSLQHFGQWTDEQCFNSLPFFCYSGYTMGLRVEFTSVESLSKSQIEDLVIIKLQEEFIRQGLPSNFTMHLRKEKKIVP